MQKFPELEQIIGRRNSVKTVVIVSTILLIIIAISTVIFLILNGYILVKSPTATPPNA
jgi:hypothetical protein